MILEWILLLSLSRILWREGVIIVFLETVTYGQVPLATVKVSFKKLAESQYFVNWILHQVHSENVLYKIIVW